jgi:hypothetical protein
MDNSIMSSSWDWQLNYFVCLISFSPYEKKREKPMIVTCTHRREIQRGIMNILEFASTVSMVSMVRTQNEQTQEHQVWSPHKFMNMHDKTLTLYLLLTRKANNINICLTKTFFGVTGFSRCSLCKSKQSERFIWFQPPISTILMKLSTFHPYLCQK